MKHCSRRSLVSAGTSTLLLVGVLVAPHAHADPPPNDSIAAATRISAVPSSFVQDITEATEEAGDGRCVRRQSIWYRYRPEAAQEDVRITTVGSDFDTQLALFRGPRESRTLLACNDDRAGQASAVRADLEAGRRYWIAVSRDDRRSAPGQAVLQLYPPTEPELSVTIDVVAAGDVSGRLYVSGTALCALPSYVWMKVVVSQRVGDDVARARYYAPEFLCDAGAPVDWRFALDSETPKSFLPGRAVVSVSARADAGVDADRWELPATVFDVAVDPG